MNLVNCLGDICLCPICFINYDGITGIPVVAACGHTLCKLCAIALSSNEVCFKCPVCEQMSTKPLATNIELMNVLEILQFDIIFSPHNDTHRFAVSQWNPKILNNAVSGPSLFDCDLYKICVTALHIKSPITFLSIRSNYPYENIRTYINWLRTICHPSVAMLTGFSDEKNSNAIAFESFCNSSLLHCLFDASRKSVAIGPVDRISIAIDVAKGVIYLQRKLYAVKAEWGISDSLIAAMLSRLQSPSHIMLDVTLAAKLLPICLPPDRQDECSSSNVLAGDCERGNVVCTEETPDAVVAAVINKCIGVVECTQAKPGAEDNKSDAFGLELATQRILRSYGQLLLVLVLNVSEEAVGEFLETVATNCKQAGSDSVDALTLAVLARMTFLQPKTTNTTPTSYAQGEDFISEGAAEEGAPPPRLCLGLERKSRPLWKEREARHLVHLALMCVSDETGQTIQYHPKNIMHALASLVRIRRDILEGSNEPKKATTPQPTPTPQSHSHSQIRSSLRNTSNAVAQSRPRLSDRNLSSRASDRHLHTRSTVSSNSAHTIASGRVSTSTAVSASRSQGGVTRGSDHDDSTPRRVTRVHYHPGYFHDKPYTRKSRFGGQVRVQPGWRCCGAAQRSSMGCVFGEHIAHHPGRWLGEGHGNGFDCCNRTGLAATESRGGCVDGPQPEPLRSAVGF